MSSCRAVSHFLLNLRAPLKAPGSVDSPAIGFKSRGFFSGARLHSSSIISNSAEQRRECTNMTTNSSVVRASATRLEIADELIDSVETFILDCDGLITLSISLYI